ncbi:hypothetical protein AAFF_G00200630 [Aldrovandia affinis]|uniref:Uncharacterized protein n=1 Tax=Aldrovandia affinis TaxID=143900 RepID=A0AAD7R014_9TELE|nr:hypothetical protein AAFF_G00200630 [Aldrovandia affinis]
MQPSSLENRRGPQSKPTRSWNGLKPSENTDLPAGLLWLAELYLNRLGLLEFDDTPRAPLSRTLAVFAALSSSKHKECSSTTAAHLRPAGQPRQCGRQSGLLHAIAQDYERVISHHCQHDDHGVAWRRKRFTIIPVTYAKAARVAAVVLGAGGNDSSDIHAPETWIWPSCGADLPEDGRGATQEAVWLKTLRHVGAEEEKDVKKAMNCLSSCNLPKIEDIPALLRLCHHRPLQVEAICSFLEEYNKHIEELKQEMEEATESARRIREDIQR